MCLHFAETWKFKLQLKLILALVLPVNTLHSPSVLST